MESLKILRNLSRNLSISKGISHPVFYGDLVYKLGGSKTDSKIVKRFRRLFGGLYDGSYPNLLRGDMVLIFVPSDC